MKKSNREPSHQYTYEYIHGVPDVTDDDELNGMDDSIIGTVTSGNYS